MLAQRISLKLQQQARQKKTNFRFLIQGFSFAPTSTPTFNHREGILAL
jgi:hypothetical protein